MEIVDYTDRYIDMIESIECDYAIALEESIKNLDSKVRMNFDRSNRLLKDIDLIKELSFELRHCNCRIIKIQGKEDYDEGNL